METLFRAKTREVFFLRYVIAPVILKVRQRLMSWTKMVFGPPMSMRKSR